MERNAGGDERIAVLRARKPRAASAFFRIEHGEDIDANVMLMH